jgi:hypothetical protein
LTEILSLRDVISELRIKASLNEVYGDVEAAELIAEAGILFSARVSREMTRG